MKMKFPDMEPLRILLNNTPSEGFCGMTPTEIHRLLYRPFDDASPLKIRPDIDNATLDSIPFFRLTEGLMKIGKRENNIKITPLGALNRKVLHELYDYKFIPEEMIENGISKLMRENDAISIRTAHYNTLVMEVFWETKGRMIFTREGYDLLNPVKRAELFKTVLKNYTMKFDWAYNDGYVRYPVGQFGWGFTIYLLKKFGDAKMTKQFYADMYLKAFPKFIDEFPPRDFSTPQRDFTNCYTLRTFERFLEWFGFVENMTNNHADRNNDIILRKDILAKIFYFDL